MAKLDELESKRKQLLVQREQLDTDRSEVRKAYDELDEKLIFLKRQVNNPSVFNGVAADFEHDRSDYERKFNRQDRDIEDNLRQVNKDINKLHDEESGEY